MKSGRLYVKEKKRKQAGRETLPTSDVESSKEKESPS